MARVAKVDNAIKKRLAGKTSSRQIETRYKRKYFLIVCEGQKTEPLYFEGLKQCLAPGILETVDIDIDGTGKNTVRIIEEAIISRNASTRKYDEVWVVFDRDSFPARNFNNAIHKAAAHRINCAWSNECFEIWYLLHFNFHDTAMNRNQYQAILEREISIRTGTHFVYQKNDPGMFRILRKYADLPFAIKNAIKLEKNYTDRNFARHNPRTRVHHLVKRLFAFDVCKIRVG